MSDIKPDWENFAKAVVTLAMAHRIEELEAKLAKVIPLLCRIKSHKVFYMEEIADLIAELKGETDE